MFSSVKWELSLCPSQRSGAEAKCNNYQLPGSGTFKHVLAYSCLTALSVPTGAQSEVAVCTRVPPSGLPSGPGLRRAPNRAAAWGFSWRLIYAHTWCARVSPNLPVPLTHPFPLGVHTCFLYIRVSISALLVRSSVALLQIPHTRASIRHSFFSV